MPSPAAPRPDPYELVFASPPFEEEAFPAIRREASEAGGHRGGPDTFVQLAAVGRLLRTVVPEDAPGAATRTHAAFLYHAFHHWAADRPAWDVAQELLAAALDAGHEPRPEVTVPAPAGYLRLPRQRLWARVDEESAAEPVDGLFWVLGEDRLDVLLVLGLREGRPGLSVLEAGTSLVDGGLPAGVLEAPRPDGEAFANILPGGELQGYRGLVTPAEALLLAARLLARLARSPGKAPGDAATGGPAGGAGAGEGTAGGEDRG